MSGHLKNGTRSLSLCSSNTHCSSGSIGARRGSHVLASSRSRCFYAASTAVPLRPRERIRPSTNGSPRHGGAGISTDAVPTAQPDPMIFASNGGRMMFEKEDLGSDIRNKLRAWQEKHGQEREQVLAPFLGLASNEIRKDTESDSNQIEGIYGADMEFSTVDPQYRVLGMGDLVELTPYVGSKDPQLAVHIRSLSGKTMSQFILMSGRWIFLRPNHCQFAIREYIPKKMIVKLIPHLPNTTADEFAEEGTQYDISVPRNISGPILDRLRTFNDEAKDLYRLHAFKLDRIHSILAGDDDLKFGTLNQIAASFFRKKPDQVTQVERYALRLALNRAGWGISWDRKFHRITEALNIRSKKQVSSVATVLDWVRDFKEELSSNKKEVDPLEMRFKSKGAKIVQGFVAKAKAVIEESRKDREPTQYGSVGPSKRRQKIQDGQDAVRYRKGPEWTDEEVMLVNFIELWANSSSYQGQGDLATQPPLLLKATGMYGGHELSERTGILLLHEIGCMQPWENRVPYKEGLMIPHTGHSLRLKRLVSQLEEADPKALLVPDRLAAIRHDWKDLPIFCIDSKAAAEIDDGVSAEKVEDGTWVHVHVANPTSGIAFKSTLARFAQHMTETLFMPDRNYTMLPPRVTKEHFSMAKGRPCLTFSAKLDAKGEIMEHKITAGIARNVYYMDHQECHTAVGVPSPTEGDFTITVGGEVPEDTQATRPMTKAHELPPSHVAQLKTLLEVARKRLALRCSNGGIGVRPYSVDIALWMRNTGPGVGHEEQGLSERQVRFCEGDPVLKLIGEPFQKDVSMTGGEVRAQSLVEECMLLAGEIAGKWCEERSLQNICRGTMTLQAREQRYRDAYYEKMIRPSLESGNGIVPWHVLLGYLRCTPPSMLSPTPQPHSLSGLSHFSKVTSPLRRFGDMVTHWSIEAGLLEEHKRGRSLVGCRDPPRLMGDAEFDAFLPQLAARESRVKDAKLRSVQGYCAQLLFRAFYFGESELPETFTVYHTHPVEGFLQQGMIMELSVQCNSLEALPGQEEPRCGDIWECVIGKIDLFTSEIRMLRTRLIARGPAVEY